MDNVHCTLSIAIVHCTVYTRNVPTGIVVRRTCETSRFYYFMYY